MYTITLHIVPRPRPPPYHSVLPRPLGTVVQAAPLQSDIHALWSLEAQRRCNRPVRGSRWMGRITRSILRCRIPLHSLMVCTKLIHIIIRALSDSDIAVRRKAAFLLNSLLIPSAPAATRAPGARIRGGPAQPEATVHPNSHASMVADPSSTDTAPETLRAVRAHGLLPVIVRELTEPTPYGPDGDEGDGCDADLEEKLMRCVL